MIPEYLFMAAGEATRWKNHLGVRKHFIKIDGEPILHRATRLVEESTGILPIVVGPDLPVYREIPHGELYVPTLHPQFGDADKFISSQPLWSATHRTVVFWGDCWFSDEAMCTIVTDTQPGVTFFGRAEASDITGTPWGELFAVAFYPEDHAEMDRALKELVRLKSRGRLTRNGGWELYREVQDPGFVEINDFTDDFDFPADYDRWITRYRGAQNG